MICPGCGARNAAEAGWCTQCYATLGSAVPTVASSSTSEDTGSPGRRGGRRHLEESRDVRLSDGEVEWRCASCDGWSRLELPTCRICGSARHGFGAPTTSERIPSDTVPLGASLALPGLGHLLAGHIGTGLARAGLALLWLGGGLLLLVSGSRTAVPGWILLAGAGVLWIATAVDSRRSVAGRHSQLLETRRLALLVASVTSAALLAMVVAAAGLR